MAAPREELATLVESQAPDASTATLIRGLIGDVQELLSQEIQLRRQEAIEELDRLKKAGLSLGPAVLWLGLAALMLAQALALGVAALLQEPAWVGYAIVGGLCALVGGLQLRNWLSVISVKEKL